MGLFDAGPKLKVYGKGSLYHNGKLAADVTKLTVKQTFQTSKPQYLLQKGYVGESPGCLVLDVSSDHAMPRLGFSFDYFDAHRSSTMFEIVIWLTTQEGAGTGIGDNIGLPKNLTMRGQLISVDFSTAPDAPSALSLAFRCRSNGGI